MGCRFRCSLVIGVLATLVLSGHTTAQTTWYVDASANCMTGDGMPLTPFCTIQQAIVAAAASGDSIEVAPGTYNELIDLLGREVDLYSFAGAASTIIDGGGVGTVVNCNTGETVDTIVRGFTITNGAATNGAGMRIINSSPTVEECVFDSNTATNGAGGIRVFGASAAPLIVWCVFVDNTAPNGGALSAVGGSFPKIVNCEFYGNSAAIRGGGISFLSSSGALANVVFMGNTSAAGAAIDIGNSTVEIGHATIVANTATNGAAIDTDVTTVDIINSIVWGNSNEQIGDQSLTVTYSLVEGEDPYPGDGNITGDPRLYDPDGPDDVAGTADDDWHLLISSPCIDAANTPDRPDDIADLDDDGNTTEGIQRDLDDQHRAFDELSTPDTGIPGAINPVVDMGADEWHPPQMGEPSVRRWVNLLVGDWVEPTNWEPNLVPTSINVALFDEPVAPTASLNAPTDIRQLIVSAGDVTLELSGSTLSLNDQGSEGLLIGPFAGKSASLTLTNGGLVAENARIGRSATSDGALTLDIGANLSLTGSLLAGGESTARVTVNAGGLVSANDVTISPRSTLEGGGDVSAALASAGSVEPGATGTPGTLTVTGSYVQTGMHLNGSDATGTLAISVEGATPGTQHDVLAVTGNATLDGALRLDFDGIYDPPLGTTLNVLTATGTVSGDFDVIFSRGLPNDRGIAVGAASQFGPGGFSVASALNTTTLGFGSFSGTLAAGAPVAAVLADFDMDTDLDLAVVTTGPDQVIVAFNDGFGAFPSDTTALLQFRPTDIVAADLDADGDLDLAISMTELPTIGHVALVCNSGSPNFIFTVQATTITAPDVGDNPLSITAGDFDGVGGDDVAVANAGDDTVSLLLNTTTMPDLCGGIGLILTASGTSPIAVGDEPLDLAAGEIDGGAGLDIAVANAGDDTVSILTNTVLLGSIVAGLAESGEVIVPDRPGIIEPENFDNNKDLDLLTVSLTTGDISLLLNEGSGTYESSVEMPLTDTTVTVLDLAAGDLDGDGDTDIAGLVEEGASKVVRVLRNDLSGTRLSFSQDQDLAETTDAQLLLIGDVDGDNVDDLVVIRGDEPSPADSGPAVNVTVNTSIAIPGPTATCDGDCALPVDAQVDVSDLLQLLADWGVADSFCDFDAGGMVDVGDLLDLLAGWGPCP